jgi:hypothetical protein
MVGRGPQRIWLAQPARAGCAVTAADVASTSRTSPVGVRVNIEVVVVVVACVLGARKIVGVEERVGRRVGRLEKVLLVLSVSYVSWEFGTVW